MFASLFEHFACKEPDQARSVNRDGNVCQADEEGHDVDRCDVVRAHSAIVHLRSANGGYGKQEDVRNERRGEEVHRELQACKLAMNCPLLGMISWRYDSSSLQ